MSKNKNKPKKIKPEVLKGFRDYPPAEEMARQKMISVFREVFESFGFSPLQTPALEKIETLKGADYGEDNLKTIFNFEGPDKVDMALRFEMTASLARFVAGNPELPLPFRRYQVGPVWRVDKPDPGRFREFTQFDIDSVGTESYLADAEIMAAICQSFEKLGLPNYRIRYSNRKILNGLAKFTGIPDDQAGGVFRVIDKLDKQGIESVKLELGLGRKDRSGDLIPGLNLPEDQIATLEKFLNLQKFSSDSLTAAAELLAGVPEAEEGIAELRQIAGFLENLDVPSNKAQVDLTIVRGLGYYTGPVFETVLDDIPEVGSVFAGGRYDGLVERFLGRKIPATGASAGIDRLLAAMMMRKMIDYQDTISEVLVTVMDRERLPEYIGILNYIRSQGLKAKIFLGTTKNLTKQLKYADRTGIPAAVILGSDEFENNQVTIKNLIAGKVQAQEVTDREDWLKAENIQKTIPRDDMIEYLRDLLKKSRNRQ
ncbi:MAG: histidine--tRNA ligase [FCB group bacterium]|nr:histidine--tRNA ligase [FCB group bacterium]